MKAYRYIVEGYHDPIHRYMHYTSVKFYIPAPYNIGFYITDGELTRIHDQTSLDDFTNDYYGYSPVIYDVDLDEAIAKQAQDLLARKKAYEAEGKQLANVMSSQYPEIKPIEAVVKEGIDLMKEKKYEEALNVFTDALKFTAQIQMIYYNIACCYSLMGEKEKAIDALKLAVKHGYINWRHIIEDPDTQPILHEPEVVATIRSMLRSRSFRPVTNLTSAQRDYLMKDDVLRDYVVQSETPKKPDVINVYQHKHGRRSWLDWLMSKVY